MSDGDLRSWVSQGPGASPGGRFDGGRDISPLNSSHYGHGSRHLIRETSVWAFFQLRRDGVLGMQEGEYLEALSSAPGGLTDGEAAVLLGLPRSTVSARRNGCNKACDAWCVGEGVTSEVLIIDSGERRLNPGVGSKKGIVWVIA